MEENMAGGTAYELTEDDQARLSEVRGQLDETMGVLNDVLGGWNHGAKAEYKNVEEVAKAVSAAHDASQRLK